MHHPAEYAVIIEGGEEFFSGKRSIVQPMIDAGLVYHCSVCEEQATEEHNDDEGCCIFHIEADNIPKVNNWLLENLH